MTVHHCPSKPCPVCDKSASSTKTWGGLFGIDPDFPDTDARQAEQTIARLTAELEQTRLELRGARLALSVVKDALAAERAKR